METNLLWTGGWDSTFRLLYILLVENKPVKPYYIVDENRRSTEFEFRAMENIRNSFNKKFPQKERLLLPTLVAHKSNIRANVLLTDKWKNLASKVHIGGQYEWLARFASQYGLTALEICISKSDLPVDKPSYLPLLLAELEGKGPDQHLKKSFQNSSLEIFKFFRFPTLHLNKNEMAEIAEQNNFYDFLEEIWFCHYPSKNGSPCEICNPCKTAKRTGHYRGFPDSNPLRDVYMQGIYTIARKKDRLDWYLEKIKNRLRKIRDSPFSVRKKC